VSRPSHVTGAPATAEGIEEPFHGTGRERRIFGAVLVAIALAVAAGAWMASTSSAPADVIGGDYPAFYGAGRIASQGDWEHLYSIDRQVQSQSDLFGTAPNTEVWFFAYPPQVAIAYVPLAGLEYHWSYLLHTMLMAGALFGAILLARPMVPWLQGNVVIAFGASMVFWPMFRAVTGGSNTALTLLLIVTAWRLVNDDRQVLAGFALAGLLFKPQFAVPIIGLFLVARYWRVVLGAAIGTAVFFASGVALLGWSWVNTWVSAAVEFGAVDAEVNGHSAISVIGFTENILGVGFSIYVAFAWLLAVAMVICLCWLWWNTSRDHLDVLLAITIPGVLFLSPHAMSHDGAVVLLTVAVAMGTWAITSWRPWVAAVWILGATQVLIRSLGFSPGFLMLLVLFAWVLEPIRDRRRQLGFRVSGPTAGSLSRDSWS
jgi:hypothetical protein